MKEVLLSLIELQKVDAELDYLEGQKGDLPQQVQKLSDELNALREQCQAMNDELTETRRLKLHWEGELLSLQENLKKHQDRRYSVTSNREYDAITTEIDAITDKIDAAETEILQLLEREEALVKSLEDLTVETESREESRVTIERDLNAKIKATEASYRMLQQQRDQLINPLSKQILYQYERIRSVKGNTAVVGVNKYNCEGCFAAIPPQKALEVRHMNQFILCESCGRILVYHNEEEQVTSRLTSASPSR